MGRKSKEVLYFESLHIESHKATKECNLIELEHLFDYQKDLQHSAKYRVGLKRGRAAALHEAAENFAKFGLNKDSKDLRKPKSYIISDTATILFWEDGTRTRIDKSSDDEHDVQKAFLIAYFQKHSGMSRKEANKYLYSLEDTDVMLKRVEESLSRLLNTASNMFIKVLQDVEKKIKGGI